MAEFKLRPEVAMFAALMEGRLRLKDPLVRVGRWEPWQEMEPAALLSEAKERVFLLEEAQKADSGNAMLIESVDAALYLMMFLDVALPDVGDRRSGLTGKAHEEEKADG